MKVIYEPKGRAREYSALAVNLYQGCEHSCQYCFAPNVLRQDRNTFNNNKTVRKDILLLLENDLKELQNKQCKDRVLLCFTSDPYQRDDDFNIVTRQALELFREYNIPFQILTKAGLKAARDFDLYSKQDAFGTTLTFLFKQRSLEIEPKAASPLNRIQAIKAAKVFGIETWVSFEPVLDEFAVYDLLYATYEYVDLYKVGKCTGYKSGVTDWGKFAHNIVNMLEKLGKKYYIKEDLRVYL